jgi:hypothetical protein
MFLYIFYLTLWRERDTTLESTKSNRVGERWIRTELASHLHYFLINNSLAAEYQMFLNSKKLLKTVSVFSIFFRILIPSYWLTGFPLFQRVLCKSGTLVLQEEKRRAVLNSCYRVQNLLASSGKGLVNWIIHLKK